MVDDDRFDKFKRDPRFKSVKHKKGTRVKVDKRFGAMFKAKSEFNQHLVRDRYGQKKNLSKQERAQILRFYENEEEGEKGTKILIFKSQAGEDIDFRSAGHTARAPVARASTRVHGWPKMKNA